MKVARSRSEIRRHDLASHLHQLATASMFGDVLLALEQWDGLLCHGSFTERKWAQHRSARPLASRRAWTSTRMQVPS